MMDDVNDFFRDGMMIFLDYIHRQSKKQPDYLPHPLIRAFMCAIQAAKGTKHGERSAGLSQDGTETNVCNPYIVILEKKKRNIEVKKIENIKIQKEIPLDVMIQVFRMQILLDRIEDDTVSPEQMVDALNAVIPGNKFYALGDRWKEARDEFKRLIEERKNCLPNDPDLISELTKIKYNTPWEDYSHKLRSLIGSSIGPSLCKGGCTVITSPKDAKIKKYMVFEMMTEFLLGKTAEYLNRHGKQ